MAGSDPAPLTQFCYVLFSVILFKEAKQVVLDTYFNYIMLILILVGSSDTDQMWP